MSNSRRSGARSSSARRGSTEGREAAGVDDDAVALRDPVTVVVSPRGNEYEADTWSDANNLLSNGYTVKEGWPTGPGQDPDIAGPATDESVGVDGAVAADESAPAS